MKEVTRRDKFLINRALDILKISTEIREEGDMPHFTDLAFYFLIGEILDNVDDECIEAYLQGSPSSLEGLFLCKRIRTIVLPHFKQLREQVDREIEEHIKHQSQSH